MRLETSLIRISINRHLQNCAEYAAVGQRRSAADAINNGIAVLSDALKDFNFSELLLGLSLNYTFKGIVHVNIRLSTGVMATTRSCVGSRCRSVRWRLLIQMEWKLVCPSSFQIQLNIFLENDPRNTKTDARNPLVFTEFGVEMEQEYLDDENDNAEEEDSGDEEENYCEMDENELSKRLKELKKFEVTFGNYNLSSRFKVKIAKKCCVINYPYVLKLIFKVLLYRILK